MVLHIHLTAFGPYGDVAVNPTSVLATALPSHIKQRTQQLPSNITIDSITQIETSAAAVEKTLTQLHAQVSDLPPTSTSDLASPTPSATADSPASLSADLSPSTSPSPTSFLSPSPASHSHLWVHLGVHPRSAALSLEHRGVNEADFRIPDQQGWMPRSTAIVPGDVLLRHTRVDVARLKMRLDGVGGGLGGGCGWSVVESWDAGRYICNLTYFTSLCRSHQRTVQAAAAAAASGTTAPVQHDSLFIHCPPFDAIAQSQQLDFLLALLLVLSGMEAEAEGSWRVKEGSGIPLVLGGPGDSAADVIGRGMLSDQIAVVGQPALSGPVRGLS